MRIWSIHPKYLDSKGLVALWRETLLAKNVLEGKTIGYRNHPQLIRFKKSANPLNAIHTYLKKVYEESENRLYSFDSSKFNTETGSVKLMVNKGQLEYEFKYLLNKLKTRDKKLFLEFKSVKEITANPLFTIVEGDVEDWEITDTKIQARRKK